MERDTHGRLTEQQPQGGGINRPEPPPPQPLPISEMRHFERLAARYDYKLSQYDIRVITGVRARNRQRVAAKWIRAESKRSRRADELKQGGFEDVFGSPRGQRSDAKSLASETEFQIESS
jgi:hypothetical protein